MRRRGKESGEGSAGEIEIFAAGRGVLVEGNPSDVAIFIDQMLEVTRKAGGKSRHLVVDGAQLAANVVAFRQAHREYFEFSDRARQLLEENGVIPAKENGYNRSFVKKGREFGGNLDWKKVDLSPEQALSMQAMAGQLALKAAIKEVVTAIERVEGKVDDLARLAKAERLGAVLGDRATLHPLASRVLTTGKLSTTDWDTVASLGPLISRDIGELRSYIWTQLSEVELKRPVRARVEQAEELTDDLLKQSIALLVVAEENYVLWQQLRLARVTTHERAALETTTHDIRQQLAELERADQALVDKLLGAVNGLASPTGYGGLAPLQLRKLKKHAKEIEATTKWFADQRHLDFTHTDEQVTALMAGLLGREVLTKDYETTRITIAFHPIEQRFEVANPAIRKNPLWIPDVARIFEPGASLFGVTKEYVERNEGAEFDQIFLVLENLKKITNNMVGVIDLAEDLDIETVTEIFIRVNSAGAELSQADFAMSKIAANETFGGNTIRKAIDYFCHLAVAPEFLSKIERGDPTFAASDFLPKMRWLATSNDDLYDPTYTDMLRVAFTSEFGRGRLQDLVALLSGRNFETKQYEEEIAEQSFARLRKGIHAFINQTHYERLIMTLRSAGFVTSSMIRSANAVNFAYILYLRGRQEGVQSGDLERAVRQWYAMSILRGRYSGSPETTFDLDIRQIETHGLLTYVKSMVESELPSSFWTGMLPQSMDTSAGTSPYFVAFQAAQVKANDLGFLSHSIKVSDLLLLHGDVHHIYPSAHLKQLGVPQGRYNLIANFARTQSEINIAISASPPEVYFEQLAAQCNGGPQRYGGITDMTAMRHNLELNCIPATMLDGEIPSFEDFLDERRSRMALKIKSWFESL